jgi:hypothetical protein
MHPGVHTPDFSFIFSFSPSGIRPAWRADEICRTPFPQSFTSGNTHSFRFSKQFFSLQTILRFALGMDSDGVSQAQV